MCKEASGCCLAPTGVRAEKEIKCKKFFLSTVKSNLQKDGFTAFTCIIHIPKMQALAWHSACVMSFKTCLAYVNAHFPRDKHLKQFLR